MANTTNVNNEQEEKLKWISDVLLDDDYTRDINNVKDFLSWEKLSPEDLRWLQSKMKESGKSAVAGIIEEMLPQETEEDLQKKQEKIKEEKIEVRNEQDLKVEDLKRLLDDEVWVEDKVDNLNETGISKMVELFKKQQEKITSLQKELLKANKEGTWNETIKQIIDEIKKTRWTFVNKVSSELDIEQIDKLKMSPLSLRFKFENRDWLSTLQVPWFRRNLFTRWRLNKTIWHINDYKDDSNKFMNYFMTKTTFYKWWILSQKIHKSGDKLIKSLGFVKSRENFEKSFFKQRELFVKNLEDNFKSSSIDDRGSLINIKKAMDYHYQNYMVDNYGWYDTNYPKAVDM